MEKELNWAVIGTGVIANEMAQALQKTDKTLYGVANRTQTKAIDFAKKYGVKKVYDEIDEVFDDENVDIIYLATSHNTHYQFMKKALEHGKHLFVEKSITLNSRELDEMMALAKEKNLILAEAMTIWHMPIYKELWKIVQSGELGKMQIMTVNFGSFKEYDMNNRFFNMNLAGGALLDIGVYALSIYSQVRVSTRILSPSLINSGTRISAPVSTVAGFKVLVAVLPLTPGSVAVTSSSTKLGISTLKTLPL